MLSAKCLFEVTVAEMRVSLGVAIEGGPWPFLGLSSQPEKDHIWYLDTDPPLCNIRDRSRDIRETLSEQTLELQASMLNHLLMGRLLVGRSFLLTGKSVFFTYSWSLLLTANWLGLFLLTVRSLLLTVETRFGLFYLRFPPRPEIGFGPFCLRFPTVSKKDEP